MNGISDDEVFETMISSFQINELQYLLGGDHDWNIFRCQKSELMTRALEFLRRRPVGFDINYHVYLMRVIEIYARQNVYSNFDELLSIMENQIQQEQMMSTNMQQPRIYQAAPHNYHQQSMNISERELPQVLPQMLRDVYASNIRGNNIQPSYQPAGARNIVPYISTNQQVNAVGSGHLQYNMSNANTFAPSTLDIDLANIRLKELPNCEVIFDIIKPTTLVGLEKHSHLNSLEVFREAIFKIKMSPEQINYISLNRNITTNEYIFQLQIRICLFEPNLTEITDFLPLKLQIQINNEICTLPPYSSKSRRGSVTRNMARPIYCTQYLKLNPLIFNTITVNWTPDAKTYVMAVYLVKKLSPSLSLQRLKEKEAKSSKETKDFIIKSLVNVDPDVATTSYRFSLLCPLGKMRMKIPAKSINCDHLQCFDAYTFFSMNEKNPTWSCPTCNKPCLYDDVQIQTYFLEVVSCSSLPDSCKEIELLADGTWKIYEDNKELVEIVGCATNKIKPIESVTLDDSDDDDSTNVKEKANLKSSNNKEFENFKTGFVDLTLSDEEPMKDEDQ